MLNKTHGIALGKICLTTKEYSEKPTKTQIQILCEAHSKKNLNNLSKKNILTKLKPKDGHVWVTRGSKRLINKKDQLKDCQILNKIDQTVLLNLNS